MIEGKCIKKRIEKKRMRVREHVPLLIQIYRYWICTTDIHSLCYLHGRLLVLLLLSTFLFVRNLMLLLVSAWLIVGLLIRKRNQYVVASLSGVIYRIWCVLLWLWLYAKSIFCWLSVVSVSLFFVFSFGLFLYTLRFLFDNTHLIK